ncbi:hypothetical protein D3C87_1006090 [compost metagenome]
MIRVIFGMCFVVSVAVPAFADPQLGEKAPAESKSVEVRLLDANQKISKLESRKEALGKTVNESQQRISSAYNSMKNAEADLMKAGGGATVPLTDKQRETFLKAKTDYEKVKNEYAPGMLKLKAELGTVDEELKALAQTVKSEKFAENIQAQAKAVGPDAIAKFNLAKVEKQTKVSESRLRTAELGSAFLELDLKTYGVDATLNDMEKIYDKSVLGAYLQDKFGQLLNSQSICSAMKRCAVSDPKKIDAEKIRQELFPESQAIRSDYYEKVNKKQAPPVQ